MFLKTETTKSTAAFYDDLARLRQELDRADAVVILSLIHILFLLISRDPRAAFIHLVSVRRDRIA